MAEPGRRLFELDPIGRDDLIGTWLAALEDARRRTLRLVEGLDNESLEWAGEGTQSVATILYHLAAVEADWLYLDVLEQAEFPKDVLAWFPADVRGEDQRLTPVIGEGLAQLVERLERVRERLVTGFGAMPLDDFRRPRPMPRADATPEWIVHHLLQHEAEHRASMGDTLARHRALRPTPETLA
jgi:uncharacterized damage-inducible protein DinB